VNALIGPVARQPVAVQASLAVLALVVVATSCLVVRRLVSPVLALLQGPWRFGLGKVSEWASRRARDRAEKLNEQWQQVASVDESSTPDEQQRLARLDERLRRMPAPSSPAYFLPTPLGNVARAADVRIVERFGLAPAAVWPRLWLVLPESVREEFLSARAAVDSCLSALIWGAAFTFFGFFAWWAVLVGAATCVATAWFWLPARVAAFADLTESAFALYRFQLYEQLRLPLPEDPDDEPGRGSDLSMYLHRGQRPRNAVFTSPEGKK
ncbi:hypothetical protein ABT279_36685, partial [Amycolatopsis sp. NPDC000673]